MTKTKGRKALTNKEFITKAETVHGNKHDYSKVDYVNAHTSVLIICIKCKSNGSDNIYYEMKPYYHLRGFGCPHCIAKRKLHKFIQRAKDVHGDKYDYSKVDYVSAHKKVIIKCKIHGQFKQMPPSHCNGSGCLDCSPTKVRTTKEFIKKAETVHDNQYDYSNTNYINARTEVIIRCKTHDFEFNQTARNHLQGSSGCISCTINKRKNSLMNKNTIKVIKGTKTTKDTINKVINFIKKIDAKSPINISSEITCLDIPENGVQIIWTDGTESILANQ